jgi:hypothetical protein
MKSCLLTFLTCCIFQPCFCWGFFGHQKINYYAVFLLPPEMLLLYKANIEFLKVHAVDPDKRRYLLPAEGPRHYIDIDQYGKPPYDQLPRKWTDAVAKFGEDSLQSHGIVPWWIQVMLERLTKAFREKNQSAILKMSAELGHYIADAHVPLHACHNHNGQYSDQKGIHGLWESRIPELLADREWEFYLSPARYIADPLNFMWKRVIESAAAADTVLAFEKELTQRFPEDEKYAFELRNEVVLRQYSSAFTIAYDRKMKGMVERRMRQSVFAVASFWYTAWVNAGQPDLRSLANKTYSAAEQEELEALSKSRDVEEHQ